ncbi:MAG TPA: sulfatase-like hydrolase/transferase [Acidimicrobiales bacterium]|nr:sulfatase-like hydrolase/transferase [Acidimicrobiales bacterium]
MTVPNVLVVLSDQQRPDTIGVYGQSLEVTPVLDGLASRGTVFDNAFCVNPVCGPARASLQSGRWPTAIGCWRNGLALPTEVPTLADRLRAVGYRTGYVGKWHLASDIGPRLPAGRPRASFIKSPIPPERRGGYTDAWAAADALELTSTPYAGHLWDEHGDEIALSGYRVDAVGDVAVDRLSRLATGDDPFLLFVSFLEPHHQNNRFRTIGPKGWASRYRDFEVPGDLAGTLGDWRWNYAQSLAACAAIDTNVGRLLDTLRATGRLDDTVVVYASDHGSHYRTRNLEYKRSCHEASINVPLIIAGPGFDLGARDDRLVTHLDLLPTLVHAADGELTDELDGRPLQQTDSSTPSWRDEVLIQISESQIGRALRTDRYTYAAVAPGRNPLRGHLAAAAHTYVETHCYDLEADPYQRHNLAGSTEHRTLRAGLAKRLRDAIERVEGVRPRVLPR